MVPAEVVKSWCADRAAEIADKLLTTGISEVGTRLQVMQEQFDGTEKDIGGWCREAIVSNVCDILIRSQRTEARLFEVLKEYGGDAFARAEMAKLLSTELGTKEKR